MLEDPTCPYTLAGPGNPNTERGCFDAMISEITRHIILILVLSVIFCVAEIMTTIRLVILSNYL